MHIHGRTLPRDSSTAMAPVGWIGQTGAVYALDDPPRDGRERGGYAHLYLQIGTWREIEPDHWAIDD